MMMDIYDWINSKDIAEYNREIGHEFNAMEAAFLVWQCERHTMDERFAAWNEIVGTMPDMVMEERRNMDRFESAHGFIRSYISFLKKKIKEFYDDSMPAIWFRETLYERGFHRGEPKYEKDDCVYSSYADCYANAVKDEKSGFDYFSHVRKFRVTKQYIGAHYGEYHDVPGKIVFEFDREGNLLRDVELTADEEDLPAAMAFEGMWIDVPVPFKKNDIVCDRTELSDGRPVLLDHTINQPTDNFPQSWIDRRSPDWDSTDMGYLAYFIEEDGTFFRDNGHNYQNLELPG